MALFRILWIYSSDVDVFTEKQQTQNFVLDICTVTDIFTKQKSTLHALVTFYLDRRNHELFHGR